MRREVRTLRVWDLPPHMLCRNHLLGEHREIHAIWSVLTRGRHGYSRHPETLRWRGKLAALYRRHESVRGEMEHRGFTHRSPLDHRLATGRTVQDDYVDSPVDQRKILQGKGCECRTDPRRTRQRDSALVRRRE